MILILISDLRVNDVLDEIVKSDGCDHIRRERKCLQLKQVFMLWIHYAMDVRNQGYIDKDTFYGYQSV